MGKIEWLHSNRSRHPAIFWVAVCVLSFLFFNVFGFFTVHLGISVVEFPGASNHADRVILLAITGFLNLFFYACFAGIAFCVVRMFRSSK